MSFDELTYAGNLTMFMTSKATSNNENFLNRLISVPVFLDRLLAEHKSRVVLRFAAETHVDRSIQGPDDFIETNVVGTFN
jgi:dTDP-glucose 4,6-dehydratase